MGRDRLKKNLRAELEAARRRDLAGRHTMAWQYKIDSLREHIKMLSRRTAAQLQEQIREFNIKNRS